MTELHPAFRDLYGCTIEPDDDGFWLCGTGRYSSGVNLGQPLFRRIRWFKTVGDAELYFAENAPSGMPVNRVPAGDFEGVKWMSGSGAPDPLDDTDY